MFPEWSQPEKYGVNVAGTVPAISPPVISTKQKSDADARERSAAPDKD